MLNVERIVYESKKLETLLSLKKGLEHASYDALLKLEPTMPISREFGLNDYFILTRDIRQVLIKAIEKKIEIESTKIESLIREGIETPIDNANKPSPASI